MKIIALSILLLISSAIAGQSGLTFSKQQMLADFDTLVLTINRVSPHLPIKKALWKYDANQEMQSLRKRIDTVTTDLSYFIVLQSVINSAQDLHTSFIRQDSGWAQKQYQDFRALRKNFKFSIGNIYHNGRYWTTDPFVIDGDTIPVGTQITHVNGQKIDAYLRKRMQAVQGMAYDLERKKFYDPGILKNTETIFKDTIQVTLKIRNKSKVYHFPTHKFTKYLPSSSYSDTSRVEYWDPERIIYIRLTDMDPEYKSLIISSLAQIKSKNLPIEKIIIDIRDNGGGQDNVWQGIFSELIATAISYPLKIDALNTGFMTQEKIERMGFEHVKIEKDRNPFLQPFDFNTILEEKEEIEPSATSLRFTGKIYLLAEQHYSSAGSAVAVASSNPADQLVSVGRKTGYFLGVGFSPLQFTLPHTRLNYTVAPSIEMTRANALKDLMQDNLEIEVPYDLDFYRARFAYPGKPTDKAFLLQYDPFFKAIMK